MYANLLFSCFNEIFRAIVAELHVLWKERVGERAVDKLEGKVTLVIYTAKVSYNALPITVAEIYGAVLVYAAFFLYNLFDTTVYTEKALSVFDLPILGTVPYFTATEPAVQKAGKAEKEVEG